MTAQDDTAPQGVDAGETAVAIVGIACRFPGASGPVPFWEMLEEGRDGLRRSGSDAGDLRPVCFSLEDRFCFDAEFFGIPPAQAALMDPQHRVFLECAWLALEDAGYGVRTQDDRTGLFAACGYNDYVLRHVGPREFSEGSTEAFAAMIGNDKDYLASRAAHLLNLTGPAIMCQSACSSGLLCVHQGVQALLSHEVNTALAGAASISVGLEDGYVPEPGGVMSPSARIAPFSADADGIVGGNGAAVLVLKRLGDALDAGDHVYATILGSAANNDGGARAGFTAPGVEGQRRVLREALGLSGLDPDRIGYIEAHGTGTKLGDPIEMQAIRDVYGAAGSPAVVGSVKGNTGHLNAAAGLAGLIKAVGVLHRQRIPPTRNLTRPNPALSLENSRFSLDPSRLGGQRIDAAAVSSFGFGGTNVHLVLGAAAKRADRDDSGRVEILPFSARTREALAAQKSALAQRLGSGGPLRDIAGTLREGRTHFPVRCAVVARTGEEAETRLAGGDTITASGNDEGVVLVFPGQGMQFAGMGAHLYAASPHYRAALDEVAEILTGQGRRDIRPLIMGRDDAALRPTEVTQLALFAVEYATARWLTSGGIAPSALLGHSIGEYVAAVLAGVMALTDALRLVAARGDLIAALPGAGMMAVSVGEETLRAACPADLSIAVVNGPEQTVLAGGEEALARFSAEAAHRGWSCRRLPVSHGFHSHLLDPILDDFALLLAETPMRPARLPVYSNETGQLADPDAIATPGYWVRHLRRTVRFGDNLAQARTLYRKAQFLLAGPGSLRGCMPLMTSAAAQEEDSARALAGLWCDGHVVSPLFPGAGERYRKLSLPGYAFARTQHILPRAEARPDPDPVCRTYLPRWTRLPRIGDAGSPGDMLWFGTEPPVAGEGGPAIQVVPGDAFAALGSGRFSVRPEAPDDYARLLAELGERAPSRIVVQTGSGGSAFGRDALLALVQGYLRQRPGSTLALVTHNMAPIIAREACDPGQALALGLLRAIPFELPEISALWLDADRAPDAADLSRAFACRDGAEDLQPLALGLRGGELWRRDLAAVELPAAPRGDVIEPGSAYVIAGGLGALGRRLAREIARAGGLPVLLGRHLEDALLEAPERDPDLAGCLEEGPGLRLARIAVEDRAALSGLSESLRREGLTVGGMFNLAGRYDSQLLADMVPGERGPNHAAKVLGTEALAGAFAAHEPRFLAVFSSMAAEVSGYAYSDYIASNLYAEARADAGGGVPVHCIAWDHWEQAGDTTVSGPAISFATGFDLLWRSLASGLPYIAVTPTDPARRLKEAGVEGRARLAVPRDAPGPGPETVADTDTDQPPLLRLARLLFAEILGLPSVAAGDDFLRLGGDSITAVRLVSRMNKVTRAEIALPEFMSARMPSALAARLSDHPGAAQRARTYLDLRAMPEADRAALRSTPKTSGETEHA